MANGTGNWLQDMKQTEADMFGDLPDTSFPSQPASLETEINSMPNSEKLSGTERWLYKTLPGVNEKYGKAIETFSNSVFGKALGYLDVLAEGFERGLGLLAQYRDMKPGDDFRLKDAWKAGSLFYDTAKLPRLKWDEEGNLVGISIDSDMPGAYAVTEARKKIQAGATLEEVREELYSGLGALAMRSQLQDTLGHIIADPLNWALAAVKPVQRLHAIRNLALTGKMDVEAMQAVQQAEKLAGNLDMAAKIADKIAEAQKNGKALSRLDRFAIALTGGIPYLKKTEKGYELLDVAKMTDKQKWLQKLNPFALTPQARASELMDVVAANIGEYLIRPNWAKDPEEFIAHMGKIARASIGDEWGHIATTIQGRTVQGILSNSDAAVKTVAAEWKAFETQRKTVDAVLELMPGMTANKIRKLAKQSPEFLMKKIVRALDEPGIAETPFAQALRADIAAGKFSQDGLAEIGKLDELIPLTKEEFYTKAMVSIQDVAAQQAIVQFGISEKGLLTKWADALKAWETLPFIKANPANMMRNIINNEVTLIGRGLHGTMTEGAIKNFWAGKWMPPQMQRAFSFAGAGEFDATKATERIMKALEGTSETLPQKIKGFANKIKLGPEVADDEGTHALLDFSHYSQKAEASASLRASTVGWMEFHNKYWNPKTGYTSVSKHLDPDVLDEMEKAVPGITMMLDDAAEAAGADSVKFQELMGANLEINAATVFKAASERLGYQVDDVLGAEVSTAIREGLPKAIQEGKVEEFVSGIKNQMEAHVDDMFQKHVENLPGIVAAQVQAGGPLQYHRIFAKSMDEFWGGNVEHAIRMGSINEAIEYAKSAKEFKTVRGLWDKIFTDSENHFGRVWKKFDAYQEGLKQGAKAAGLKYPDEVASSFKDMQKGWKELFDFRNTEYKKFFEDVQPGNFKEGLERIQAQVDDMYAKMVNKEDELFQRIDDLMAQQLDKKTAATYTRYRDMASEIRVEDRKTTAEFFKRVRRATPEEAQKLWGKYWQERAARLEKMRQLEMRGSSAVQGDPNATAMFEAPPTEVAEPNTIFGLAAKYGIPSASKKGVRTDRRILNTVNKYMSETRTGKDVISGSKLPIPDDVRKTFGELEDARKAFDELSKAPVGDDLAASSAALAKAREAKKAAQDAYNAALKKNNIDGKLISKLAAETKYTRVDDVPMEVAERAFILSEARKAGVTDDPLAAVNEYVEANKMWLSAGPFNSLDEVKPQLLKEVLDAKAGITPRPAVDSKAFIPDAEQIFKDPMPLETGLSEMNYGRSYAALDTIIDTAKQSANRTPTSLKNLPEHLQKKAATWMRQVEDEMSAFRSAAVQYSAFRRDSALLNYSRRTNFDTMVGNIAPFAFWTTHSVANWAIHSIDRPAMLTSYLRTKQFFNTAGLQDQNVPTRLRGNIRVPLPFMPDWMGDAFVDPLRMALPFDQWAQPWEQAARNKISVEGKAEKTLEQMLEAGVISQTDFDKAMETRSGDAWEEALETAQNGGDNYDAMDFVSMTMTPHAPLMWAYNAATGQQSDIGPFTPLTKTVKNFATMMGVDDWSNHPYNMEAKIRKSMGLPAYDKWDDYRVQRQISNLAADGNHDLEDIKRAMEIAALVESGKMDSKAAVAENKIFAEATKRANQEAAGGWAGTILGVFGVNVKAYPTGEQKQRELAEKFSDAYVKYENGDVEALGKFFDDYPEYESRLALFKSPEERIKSFMIDNMWTRWNEFPKVQQDEIKEQLGSNFQNLFMNKETRNYDSITPEQLQVWLKLTGGRVVGQLSTSDEILIELNQLELTSPETAWRVQTFYEMRNNAHPEWRTLQEEYYRLPETGADRNKFLKNNPELKEYWNDRADWMSKNPDLVRFLTDNEKQLKKYANAKRNPQVAVPTADEIRSQFSPQSLELLQDFQYGQPLPASMNRYLAEIARMYGMNTRTLMGILYGNTQ